MAIGLLPLACAAGVEPERAGNRAEPSLAEVDPASASPFVSVDMTKSCAPGETSCGGKCVFLSSDLDNCGACGFSCAGGSCSIGLCELAAVTNDVQGLAAHGDSVYFSEIIFSYPTSGSLSKVSINGGKPTVLANVDSEAFNIVADSSGVYFTDFGAGTVSTIGLEGGTVTTLASGQNEPRGLAIDSSTVYWANYGAGTIMAVARAGGATSQIASGQRDPWGISLHDGTLLWSNYDSGSIVKLRGTTLTTLTSTSFSEGVVTSGTTVIWSEAGSGAGGGAILAMPIAGGKVTTIASGLTEPVIAADETDVYWVDTNVTSGTIMKAPIAGGSATVLASGQSYPVAIAVDGAAVVWATESAVMKVVKD